MCACARQQSTRTRRRLTCLKVRLLFRAQSEAWQGWPLTVTGMNALSTETIWSALAGGALMGTAVVMLVQSGRRSPWMSAVLFVVGLVLTLLIYRWWTE
jgi:hypothetical protein